MQRRAPRAQVQLTGSVRAVGPRDALRFGAVWRECPVSRVGSGLRRSTRRDRNQRPCHVIVAWPTVKLPDDPLASSGGNITREPVRVSILDDYAVVIVGVAGLLAPFAEEVKVVERVAGVSPVADVDVLLYDTFAQPQGDVASVSRDVPDLTPAKLAVYSWNTNADLVAGAIANGAAGYLSKGLEGSDLAQAIRRIHDGELVLPRESLDGVVSADLDWPGKKQSLTARESEIIASITQGLGIEEIAERCSISRDSVRTITRLAYRKLGIERRAQAVLWGAEHGFEPDTIRW